ncbi:hypothetical protein Ddc_22178 [Ditylenchus destructor]|nr:hypothetical protein Ddc_22178 [Ditylenchus destructor]
MFDISNNIKTEKLLVKHFNEVHDKEDVRIRVVHKLNNSCEDTVRREAENFWMHQLVTIYPFGMNDKVDGMEGMATDTSCHKNNLKHYFCNPLPNVKRRNRATSNNTYHKYIPTGRMQNLPVYVSDMYKTYNSISKQSSILSL